MRTPRLSSRLPYNAIAKDINSAGCNAMKRARLSLPMLAALIFTLTSAPIVRAQDYPVRTVTIIVPFAVGGTSARRRSEIRPAARQAVCHREPSR
jgi:hypothetical protein